MSTIATGLAFGLVCVLYAAAVAKVRHRTTLEMALVQLFPRGVWSLPGLNSRLAARAVVVVELCVATGALVGLVQGYASPFLLGIAALMICFALTRDRARRLEVPCGCAGQSARPANRADVIRIAGLAGLAAFAGLQDPVFPHAVAHAWLGIGAVALTVLIATFPREVQLIVRGFSQSRSGAKRNLQHQRRDSGSLSRRQLIVRTGAAALGLTVLSVTSGIQIASASHEGCSELGGECERNCALEGGVWDCDGCCLACEFRCVNEGFPGGCEGGEDGDCNGNWPET